MADHEVDSLFARGVGNPFDRHDLGPQESLLGMHFDLLAAPDLPEHLPPMRLPAQAELAAAAGAAGCCCAPSSWHVGLANGAQSTRTAS